MTRVVRVTKKGQATIPKELREKFGIVDTVVFSEGEGGILVRRTPKPGDEYGSLKKLFGRKTSRQVLVEARMEDSEREKRLLKHVKNKGSV